MRQFQWILQAREVAKEGEGEEVQQKIRYGEVVVIRKYGRVEAIGANTC